MTDQAEPCPTYVIVGHLTRDVVPGGYTPGGTALYSTLTARRLGCEVGVVTSVPPDFDLSVLEGARVSVVPSDQASTFDNRYGPEGRVQYLYGRAAPLGSADVPAAWLGAPILHLGPLTNEVDPAISDLFPRALRAATPQGWLRRWDQDGRVRHVGHDQVIPRLHDLDVVVMSEEDVAGDEGAVDAYRRRVPIVVLTRGVRGATVYTPDGSLDVAAYRAAVEVDPTGAGDVFAAAFLVHYRDTRDLMAAARFAAATASFVVEGPGASTVPTRERVEERMMAGALIAVT